MDEKTGDDMTKQAFINKWYIWFLDLPADQIGEKRRELEKDLDSFLSEAINLIKDLHDEDDCWFDHHGHCQAHGQTSTDICPHERAKEFLKRHGLL